MRTLAGVGLCLVLLQCLGVGVRAHEIGTTRVSATVTPGSAFRVEVVTDAAALLEKVEAMTGDTPTPGNATAAHIEARLRAHRQALADRIRVAFDGRPARSELSVSVVPPVDAASAPAATIVLAGRTPAGARQFAWRFAWTYATYPLSLRTSADADPTTVWVEGDATTAPLLLDQSAIGPAWWDTTRRYVALGFTHILPLGLDHVLFVLGLFLLNSQPRLLLTQVSAFTAAHSITLGLGMYGLVSLPARLVEPAIALSIAYVAIENLCSTELRAWRIWLVFGFGLLHGLGFAGVLAAVGLPRGEYLTALLSFNLGVEAAQLTVLAAASALVGVWCAARPWYRTRIALPASAAIACTGLVWAVQRLP
ncbi:MAG TPA: HupE/UreJ family protein [Vicinamibacterales bacterium]|nr:HupE/UreJ family protein [Vicinamibacterales bacterium]